MKYAKVLVSNSKWKANLVEGDVLQAKDEYSGEGGKRSGSWRRFGY